MLKLGQITTRAGGLMWALSGHSLQIERMTGLAQNLNLSRRSKGRGHRHTIRTHLTRTSNVGGGNSLGDTFPLMHQLRAKP